MKVDGDMFLRRSMLIAVSMLTLVLAACDPKATEEQSKESAASQGGVGAGAAKKAGQTVDDLALNIKVEDALKESAELKSLDIKARTAGGVVTISGAADSTINRDRATKIVMQVSGVKSVKNELVVTGK